MTKKVQEAMIRMLVANLREQADEIENIDIEESIYYAALADEVEHGTASDDQIIEAMEIISLAQF